MGSVFVACLKVPLIGTLAECNCQIFPMNSLRTIFFLDSRSLAFFRILLGSLIAIKIVHLFPNLGLILADDGLLPRSLLAVNTTAPWEHLSVYSWIGSSIGIDVLACCHLAIAAAFILGWRTRWVAPLLWFFTVSLNMRNPMILNGGDKIMTTFLFWGLFLPLGEKLSLDSIRTGNHPTKTSPPFLTAFASTCFVLQLVILYTFSGYSKSHPIWTLDFDALRCALLNGAYTRPLGQELLQYPQILKVLTVATLYLEQLLVLLVLSPYFTGFFRTAIPLLFISFHIGIALTLDVGLFSYACMIAWVSLLPTSTVNYLQRSILSAQSSSQVNTIQKSSKYSRVPHFFSFAIMAYLIVGTISPGQKNTLHRMATEPVRALKLKQRWRLYAPHPAFTTRWFAIRGVTDGIAQITVYPSTEGHSLPTDAETITKSYPAFYLRKYFYILARKDNPALFQAAVSGFQNYWLKESQRIFVEWIIICWTRSHYPSLESDFTSEILYSTRGKSIHSRHNSNEEELGESQLE